MKKIKKLSIVEKNNISNVFIDDKPLKSIGGNFFDLNSNKLANFLKDEISISKTISDIKNLIFYQVFSLAIDKIKDNKIEYVEKICEYSDTDLICYRAEAPHDLCKLQEEIWDPVLDKLKKINIKFNKFTGIIPKSQPRQSTEILKKKNN